MDSNQILNNDTVSLASPPIDGAGYHTGGIVVTSSEPGNACAPSFRDVTGTTIRNNTIGNNQTPNSQAYGIFLSDRGGSTTGMVDTLTVEANNSFVSNTMAQVFADRVVTRVGSAIAPTLTQGTDIGVNAPRVLPISPTEKTPIVYHEKCRTANSVKRQMFELGAVSEYTAPTGSSNIKWIQAVFSLTGNQVTGSGGPNNGSGGCHVYFDVPSGTLILDGPTGGNDWIDSSVVGPGGHDMTSGSNCTIHAANSTYELQGNIVRLKLDVEFLSGTASQVMKMYAITSDKQDMWSASGSWKYWGWWQVPTP